jgi:hypothetical protein
MRIEGLQELVEKGRLLGMRMKTKKITITIAVSGLFLFGLALLFTPPLTASYTVSAQHADQVATPIPTQIAWTGNFVVRADLPFVWVRIAPQPSAANVATMYPKQILTAAVAPDGLTQVWDGTQWWGFVTVPGSTVSGWVEVASLEPGLAPTPTPTTAPEAVASWGISTAVRVREAVGFVWLRQRPSSDAIVLFKVPAGSVMVTIAKPQSDNVQNWWPVLDVQSGLMGWVEQNSLQPASWGADIAAATLVPVPTSESWQPGNKVRVRANMTASWVRVGPNSHAPTLTQVFSGNILDLVGTPLFADGQWWWLVKTRGSNITGWIAASALEIAPSDA